MKRALLASIVSFFSLHLASAEVMYYPEMYMLMTCDAAVEASFVKNDGAYFWIKVRYVYKLDGHEMKPHDFIRIKQVQESYFTSYYDFSAYSHARFYLQFKDNEWKVFNGGTQGVKRSSSDTMHFDLEFSQVALPLLEFRRCIKEFTEHYELNPTSGAIETKLPIEELERLKQSNALVAAFAKDQIEEVVEEPLGTGNPTTPEIDAPLTQCGFLDKPPVFGLGAGESALASYLKDSVNYPAEMIELGIEGNSYARFVINADGTLGKIEILRSLGTPFDMEIERVLETMPLWTPAMHRGRPQACETILPFRFKKK